jgi:hypothetical protein
MRTTLNSFRNQIKNDHPERNNNYPNITPKCISAGAGFGFPFYFLYVYIDVSASQFLSAMHRSRFNKSDAFFFYRLCCDKCRIDTKKSILCSHFIFLWEEAHLLSVCIVVDIAGCRFAQIISCVCVCVYVYTCVYIIYLQYVCWIVDAWNKI